MSAVLVLLLVSQATQPTPTRTTSFPMRDTVLKRSALGWLGLACETIPNLSLRTWPSENRRERERDVTVPDSTACARLLCLVCSMCIDRHGRGFQKLVSFPDCILRARRKNGSGEPPIPFLFKCAGMLAHCSFVI